MQYLSKYSQYDIFFDKSFSPKRDGSMCISVHSPTFAIPSVIKMIMSKLLSGTVSSFLAVINILMPIIMASSMLVTENQVYSL